MRLFRLFFEQFIKFGFFGHRHLVSYVKSFKTF